METEGVEEKVERERRNGEEKSIKVRKGKTGVSLNLNFFSGVQQYCKIVSDQSNFVKSEIIDWCYLLVNHK